MLKEFDLTNENFMDLDWKSRAEEKEANNPVFDIKAFMHRIEYMQLKTALEDIAFVRRSYSKLSMDAIDKIVDILIIIDSALKSDDLKGCMDYIAVSNLTKLLLGKCYYIDKGVQHEITLRPDELYVDYLLLLNYINADFEVCINSFSTLSKTNIKVLEFVNPSEYAISLFDLSAFKLVNEFKIKTLQYFLEFELKKSIIEITHEAEGVERIVLVTNDWSVLGSSSYTIKTWSSVKQVGHISAACLEPCSDEINILDIPILSISKVRKMLLA